MVLLGSLGSDEATPREYLENSDLLFVLEKGMDEMLQKHASGDIKEDPLNFLAAFLKRNNPLRCEEMKQLVEEMRAARLQAAASERESAMAKAADGHLVPPEGMQLAVSNDSSQPPVANCPAETVQQLLNGQLVQPSEIGALHTSP